MELQNDNRLQVRILGGTAVAAGGGARPVFVPVAGAKPRQLLGMLAVRLGEPLSKDQLADQLWDGEPPPSYLATLESYVCVLRRQLRSASGHGKALATTSRGYLLDPSLVQVDAAAVRSLLRAAESASGADVVILARQALELVDGALLSSEPYAAWAVDQRHRFENLVVGATVRVARAANRTGDHGAAVELAGRALDIDPLAEPAWVVRMEGLAASAHPVEAMRCYNEMRRLLGRELGLAPGRQAEALYESLLTSAPRPPVDAGGEVRALLGLLRTALESLPDVVVPIEDHRLSAVAAEFLGAA